jgi:hypothetical protein
MSSSDNVEKILKHLQYGTTMSDNQEPMLTNNRNIAKTALDKFYASKFIELIGADENEMPSWGSGKLAGDSRHTKEAQIRNKYKTSLRKAIKELWSV